MVQWLRRTWVWVRNSFWFVPTMLCIGAVALGFVLVEADRFIEKDDRYRLRVLIVAGEEGARAVLTVIAGSMITVAGTVFSITILTLSLTSQQFGPRLLRNFMRDRGNQYTLGTFVATFLYCVVVLRTVSGRDGMSFVPHLSVHGAALLAVVSVGVLIYFIHHVAVGIQASSIIALVAGDLNREIDRMFPKEGKRELEDGPEEPQESQIGRVPFEEHGYVRTLSTRDLLDIASEADVTFRVRCSTGDFVSVRNACVVYWPDHALTEAMLKRVRDAVEIGPTPTPRQDPLFGIEQLVEVAVRALSASINDPFTAIACVDELGAALSRVATRAPPVPYHRDDAGRVRVITRTVTLGQLVHHAFSPLRQYAAEHTVVALRALDRLHDIAICTRFPEDAAPIEEEARWLAVYAAQRLREGDPLREDIDRAFDRVRHATVR